MREMKLAVWCILWFYKIEKGRGFTSNMINERNKRYEGKSGVFDMLDDKGSGPARYIFLKLSDNMFALINF